MSAPPFALLYTPEAQAIIKDLAGRSQYAAKYRKIRKALRLLKEIGPSHPGLYSHPYQSIPGPGGVSLWEAYVENRTPSAWRIWWIYGSTADTITIVTLGPHP